MAFPWSEAMPLVLLVLAAIALASIPLLRAVSKKRSSGSGGTREGPVPVPPEEAELVEGPVTACMRCGSTDVGLGSVLQGSIPGAGDQFSYVCRHCRHRGAPLEFENVTAYRQFVKGLHEGPEKEA